MNEPSAPGGGGRTVRFPPAAVKAAYVHDCGAFQREPQMIKTLKKVANNASYDLDTPAGMANAIAWTKSMLAQLSPNGVWAVPRSGTLVHFDQVKKTASIAGLLPDPSLARVLTAMGFTVTERTV